MKRQRPDFEKRSSNTEYYDLYKDWELIEASLAKQYGIRIRHHTDMPWTEFCTLVGGLMPDTPLGGIVAIRAEKDPKVIKKFSPDQKRIHREWQLHMAKSRLNDPKTLEKDFNNLSLLFKKLFYKQKEVRQ